MKPDIGRAMLWGAAVLFAGFLMLAHGCARFLGGGGHVFGAEETDGRIVSITPRTFSKGNNRRGTVVEAVFEFEAGGRTVRVEDKTGFTATRRKVGDTVRVFYHPAAPEKATVGGTAPFTVTPYLFELIFGWIIVIATAILMILAVVTRRRA